MNKESRSLLLFAMLALVLTACTDYCTEYDIYTNRPEQTGPPDHSLVSDLRPILTWDYDPCTPTEYIINLSVNATNGTVTDTGFGGATGSSDKEWSPSVDLTPGTAYIWQVTAKNGTLIGLPSEYWWEFIVGPACEASSLIAPDPIEPTSGNIFGATIDTLEPAYIWDYTDPACTPGGYALQVSENSDFTSLVINMRENNPIKAWFPDVTLDDCERYYWRVAAIDGATDGPWSAVLNFKTNAYGNCDPLIAEVVDEDILPLLPICGNGIVEEGEQCDDPDLTMCLSSQVCEDCQCITYIDDIEILPEICIYHARNKSYCRESDFKDSDEVKTLEIGDSADLIALNPEYTHGLFEFEDGKQCWIWLGLMDGDENPFHNCPLEIVNPPEAPVLPPELVCHEELNKKDCIAAGGKWVEANVRTPYCACPEG